MSKIVEYVKIWTDSHPFWVVGVFAVACCVLAFIGTLFLYPVLEGH